MDAMKPYSITTFNSPLEAGLRAVAILAAAYPESYDLQRMVEFDHILVHTSEFGGPESLHPKSPMQSAELLVRRGLIEKGLLLMMMRNLIEREIGTNGIEYCAGENAAPFFASIQSDYLLKMKDYADWMISSFGSYTEEQLREILRSASPEWVEEFQSVQQSLGQE